MHLVYLLKYMIEKLHMVNDGGLQRNTIILMPLKLYLCAFDLHVLLCFSNTSNRPIDAHNVTV